MEALWNLEDKWKLSTQEALLLFACTAFLVVGLCAAAVLTKRAQRKQFAEEELDESDSVGTGWSESQPGWCSMKKVLMSSVRWSGTSGSRGETQLPPLLVVGRCKDDAGWQSHNSVSPPVWQRPILMGEKCELPRFSGLILYDKRGRPLRHSGKETTHTDETAAVVTTPLRDFL